MTDYTTYILLTNPGDRAARVTVTFLRAAGASAVKNFAVRPNSRVTVGIGGPSSSVPELAHESFGAIVASDVPLAVERALYGTTGGAPFSLGTNATATRLP